MIMEINKQDLKVITHEGQKMLGIINTSDTIMPLIEHVLKSSKAYNKLIKEIEYDKDNCLCKSKAHCSYCKHRIQLEEMLE